MLTAADGSEAVTTVRREKPDLILLDLDFPPDVAFGGGVPWDGFLIIDWLRRMDEGRNIPIIVITGGDPAQSDPRSLAAGVRKVFHKPIDQAALLVAIRDTLGSIASRSRSSAGRRGSVRAHPHTAPGARPSGRFKVRAGTDKTLGP